MAIRGIRLTDDQIAKETQYWYQSILGHWPHRVTIYRDYFVDGYQIRVWQQPLDTQFQSVVFYDSCRTLELDEFSRRIIQPLIRSIKPEVYDAPIGA